MRERFGVEPRTLIDIQALMGDSIDNIKGVPGVGEKTATSLIQEFGSLDKLYENLAKVEESKKIRGAKKVAALLAEHRESAMLSRKLVTIDCEVPLDLGPEDFTWEGIDEKALSEILRELEFTTLLQELTPSEVAIPVRAGEEIEVTEETLAAALEELGKAPRLSLNLERQCHWSRAVENLRRGENVPLRYASDWANRAVAEQGDASQGSPRPQDSSAEAIAHSECASRASTSIR